jgi:hypothetical protein
VKAGEKTGFHATGRHGGLRVGSTSDVVEVIGDVRLAIVWIERGEGAGRSGVVPETQTKKKVGWLSRWKCVGRTVWFD